MQVANTLPLRVFDAGNDLSHPAALLTALKIDPEHALEARRPAQRNMFGYTAGRVRATSSAPAPPPGRYDLRAQPMIRRKDSVVAGC